MAVNASFGSVTIDDVVNRLVTRSHGVRRVPQTDASAEALRPLADAAPLDAEEARARGVELGDRVPAGASVTVDPGRVADGGAGFVHAFVCGLRSTAPGDAELRLALPDALDLDEAALELAVALGDGMWAAARLIELPASILTTDALAGVAARVAAGLGLECTDVAGPELTERGFGCIAGMGAGSVQPAHLVELSGPGPVAAALVGKGVVFDSGGLALKSPEAMMTMRTDMAGAALALCAIAALARVGLAQGIRAVLPIVENLPGPGSVRPGDLLHAYDGTTVQMIDSDFEGRVILSDALAWASRDRPAVVVSAATLTYQAGVALGQDIAALLARDDALAAELLSEASAQGDSLWRLPWATRYLDHVRVAPDVVRNHPLHATGRAITAALFLGEFVPADIRFAHLDLTGTVWHGDGSTGHGVGAFVPTLAAVAVRAAGVRGQG